MLDELKREVAFDSYIIFLLGLGFSKSDVILFCKISRQHLYNVIERHRVELERWEVDIPETDD